MAAVVDRSDVCFPYRTSIKRGKDGWTLPWNVIIVVIVMARRDPQGPKSGLPGHDSEPSAPTRSVGPERKPVWVKMTRERRKRVLEARGIIARGAMRDVGDEDDMLREFISDFTVPDSPSPRKASCSRKRMSNQSHGSGSKQLPPTSDSSFVAEADAGAGISSGTEALGGHSVGSADEDYSDSDQSDLGSFRLSEVEDIDDYYELLDVHPQSDAQEIRDAYRWLALHTHPDKCGGSEHDYSYTERAVKVFQRVGEAYRTLSNPFRRWVYDEYGDSGLALVDDGDEKDIEELRQRYVTYMKDKEPGKEHYQGRAKRRRGRSRQKVQRICSI
ncbi:DnaJ, sub C member 18 [Perkinsus olseni]|uniref:DnaJ, sub C member 18 n=1 Tax=Perkinsus olseni TaxID=32597 RepID=A0A7J6NPY7_PEROL|nr:DnaJ, sub C member 18 [Perkinsus olseni]